MSQQTYNPGDLVHTGDYYVYQVVRDGGNTVTVTPAYGYPLQWGDREGAEYGYQKTLLYPGDQRDG